MTQTFAKMILSDHEIEVTDERGLDGETIRTTIMREAVGTGRRKSGKFAGDIDRESIQSSSFSTHPHSEQSQRAYHIVGPSNS